MNARKTLSAAAPAAAVAADVRSRPSSLQALSAQPAALSMQDRVYRFLKELIAAKRIRPGQRLLETHVVEACAVSRSPARIALQQLYDEGLLTRDAAKGFIVGGRALVRDMGQIATLERVEISTAARWEPIYAEIERELCTRILFRSVRVTEERLAEHFGVSRTVARDVLARLHSQGLVSKNRAGHWVADQISLGRARDLYEMRWLLEPQALIQSVPNTPRGVLVTIERSLIQAKSRVSELNGSDVEALENELHKELLSRCRNRELLRMIEHTHLLLSANRYIQDVYHCVSTQESIGVIEQHLLVVQQASEGKLDQAAEALQKHLQFAYGVWDERYAEVSKSRQAELPPYFVDASSDWE